MERDFAISTSCCLPTPMSAILVAGLSLSPTRARSFAASTLVAFQSMKPPLDISLPRKMFSAMERKGLSASSWWMITTPDFSLSRMLENLTTSFSSTMSPSYEPAG